MSRILSLQLLAMIFHRARARDDHARVFKAFCRVLKRLAPSARAPQSA